MPLGLQRVGRIAAEDAAGDQGLRDRLQHDAAAQFLHHHHAFDRAHAHAAMLLGDVQAGQAELGQLFVGAAVETAGLHDGAAPLEVVALVHPAAHGVTQLLLLVGKIEVHLQSPESVIPDRVRG